MGFFRRLEALSGIDNKNEQVPESLDYVPEQSVWLERVNFPPIKGNVVSVTEDGRVEVISDVAEAHSEEAKGKFVNKKDLDAWQQRNK